MCSGYNHGIMKINHFFLFILLIGINNCAIFFKEPGSPPKVNGVPISDNLRVLYVQNFQNNSYGPGLHVMLTQALKAEIDRRGRFIQTREKSQSYFKLYGSINHYQKVGNLLDLGNQQLSSEIAVVVKLELQELGGERITLERDEIMVRAYFSDQLGYRESEEQAQARLMNTLSIRISEEIENAWYYYIRQKYYPEKSKQ
jgi:hypothetical protein